MAAPRLLQLGPTQISGIFSKSNISSPPGQCSSVDARHPGTGRSGASPPSSTSQHFPFRCIQIDLTEPIFARGRRMVYTSSGGAHSIQRGDGTASASVVAVRAPCRAGGLPIELGRSLSPRGGTCIAEVVGSRWFHLTF